MKFNKDRFAELIKYHFPKTSERKRRRFTAVIDEFAALLSTSNYGSVESFYEDLEAPEELDTLTKLTQCARDVESCTAPDELAGRLVNVFMAIDDAANFLYETFDFEYKFDSIQLERISYLILVTSAVRCVDKYTWETLPTPAKPLFRLYFDRARYTEMVNQSRATWAIDEKIALDKLQDFITFVPREYAPPPLVDEKHKKSLVEHMLDDLMP